MSDRTQDTSDAMSIVHTRITAQLPTTPKKSIVPAIAINRLRRERISRFVYTFAMERPLYLFVKPVRFIPAEPASLFRRKQPLNGSAIYT